MVLAPHGPGLPLEVKSAVSTHGSAAATAALALTNPQAVQSTPKTKLASDLAGLLTELATDDASAASIDLARVKADLQFQQNSSPAAGSAGGSSSAGSAPFAPGERMQGTFIDTRV